MLRPTPSLLIPLCLLLLSGCDPAQTLFTEEDPGDDPVARLIKDLDGAGVEAARAGTITQPFLSGDGHVLRALEETIQVFVYPDADAARREAGGISPDGSSIVGQGTATMVTWVAAPHFFRRDRVIVLYVGEETTMLAALESVLGPPFAGR